MTGIRVTVTVPKSILDSSQVVAGIKSLLRGTTGPDLEQMFQGTTEGWETSPDFSQKFNFGSDSLGDRKSVV